MLCSCLLWVRPYGGSRSASSETGAHKLMWNTGLYTVFAQSYRQFDILPLIYSNANTRYDIFLKGSDELFLPCKELEYRNLMFTHTTYFLTTTVARKGRNVVVWVVNNNYQPIHLYQRGAPSVMPRNISFHSQLIHDHVIPGVIFIGVSAVSRLLASELVMRNTPSLRSFCHTFCQLYSIHSLHHAPVQITMATVAILAHFSVHRWWSMMDSVQLLCWPLWPVRLATPWKSLQLLRGGWTWF